MRQANSFFHERNYGRPHVRSSVVLSLAALVISASWATFAAHEATAAAPLTNQADSDGLQETFSPAADDLCVPARPLIVQRDGMTQSGDVRVSLAGQTQVDGGHTNMLLASASESPLEVQQGGLPTEAVQCPPCNSWNWLDTLELFGGLEGSKQPQDFGVNAEFGGRLHVNWGVPLLPAWGIGVQVGTAVDLTDNAVQVFERLEGNSDRVQEFTTVGLFQRIGRLNWAVVYDFLYEDYYDKFDLGQVRAKVGYHITHCDEIGAWGTIATEKDSGTFGAIPVTLRPIDQASLFWRHTWENCSETTVWAGGCPGHGQVNLALGDLPPVGARVVFGADVHIPLSDSWALFGEANFLTPANSGTVDAYLGFAYYFGGTAHGFRQRQFAPVLPVADATSFAVDLGR
jgi:hypothetical protein